MNHKFVAAVIVCWMVDFAVADELVVDCAVSRGTLRPLHGVNGGPVNYGGTIDLSKQWRDAGIPLARLHDCEWPGGRVVDFSTIFPDPQADPESPQSYRFTETDDYLAAVLKTGAAVVFRLGESIEHTPRKYRVHPPADPERWAAACIGIIRHYNEGWADGFQHKIRYWEIWNEPENRPACWTGDDEAYFRLYETAAFKIKRRFPDLHIGGPAVGAVGDVQDGVWAPTPFVQKFLERCRDRRIPLDFFSWHTYSDDPHIFRRKSTAIRRHLDALGFAKTEIHLNEWNYLPDNDWGPVMLAGQGRSRRLWYEKMAGPSGAAFTAFVLCDLQDSPVDAAAYFTGDSSPFGLFTRDGEPKHTFGAFRAFHRLLETPRRISARGAGDGAIVVAGIDEAERAITLLFSQVGGRETKHSLTVQNTPWEGKSRVQTTYLDARRNVEVADTPEMPAVFHFESTAPSVVVLRITPAR